MASIEELTEQSREQMLSELMDYGRSCTPVEYTARTEISRLTARIEELENVLGYFLTDTRFQVAVGGTEKRWVGKFDIPFLTNNLDVLIASTSETTDAKI